MTALPINEQFLLAEDAALKAQLEGIQLPEPRDTDALVDVGVWFRWPQREYADGLFPFITLDLMQVEPDYERMHSYNYDIMNYNPDTTPEAATPINYNAAYPIPFTLIYLVASHTRNARHDRLLFNKLLAWNRLPRRFGQLYVPVDQTVRRLDVHDIAASTDFDALKKRVFRRMFTIGISAEMLPEEAVYAAQLINDVIYDPTSREGFADPST